MQKLPGCQHGLILPMDLWTLAISADESNLLDSIGTVHMERELQNRVLGVAKKQEETTKGEPGIQPSLTEEDMKQDLDQVLQEIKHKS